MAATVTGAFVILDRASGPMKKMERQANQTDRAIESLGRRLDKAFGSRSTQNIDMQTRAVRNLNREATAYSGTSGRITSGNDRLGRSFRSVERDTGKLERGMRKLVIVTEGFGRVLKFAALPLKFAGIAAGVGILVKALVALGGGLVAMVPRVLGAVGSLASLLPKLTDLGGLAGAALPALAGMGLAMVTVKLATSDLTKALAGNKNALARLTPEGKQFLGVLKGWQPIIKEFRESAQKGLFGGLTDALKNLRGAAPTVNALIGGMSKQLGALARQAGRQFSQRGFLQDLFSIGTTGTALVGNGGRSILSIADALRHVAVAAEPLARWIGKVVEGWAKYVDKAAQAGRESGALARYFDRTRSALTQFGHIIRDVFFAVRNIFGAARDPGNSMWGSIAKAAAAFRAWTASVNGSSRIHLWFERAKTDAASLVHIFGNLFSLFSGIGQAGGRTGNSLWDQFDKATAAWARFSHSVTGQYQLTTFFQGIHDSFVQIALLLKDLGVGVYQIGNNNQRGFPALIEKIRTFVPIIVSILTSLTNTFGGPMLTVIQQFGRTIALLSNGSGPLTVLLSALTTMLRVVNAILSALSKLGPLLPALLTFAGITIAIAKVKGLASAWFGVAAGANAAAGAETRAVAIAAGGAGAAGAARAVGRAGVVSDLPLIEAAAGGGIVGRLRRAGRTGALGRILRGTSPELVGRTSSGAIVGTAGEAGLLTAGAGLSRLGGLGGIVGAGARVAGKFALPAAIALGLLDAITTPRDGNFGNQTLQTLAGVAHGATFGLIPTIKTSNEKGDATTNALINGGVISGNSVQGRHFNALGSRTQTPGFNAILGRQGGNNPRSIAQEKTQIREMIGFIGRLRTVEGDAAKAAVIGYQQRIAVMRATISQSMALRREIAKETLARKSSASIALASRQIAQFGGAINVLEKQGMSETAAVNKVTIGHFAGGNILQNLSKLRPEAKKQAAQQYLGWLDAAAEKNPALQKTYDKLKTGIIKSFADSGTQIKIVNDKILDGSKRKWTEIADALTNKAELARKQVVGKFTTMQQEAIAQLELMGFNRTTSWNIVLSIHGGANPGSAVAAASVPPKLTGAGHAMGGRLGGFGLSDRTMRVMAAPGELIVNRHTEARVNRMLSGAGTSLGREVYREGTPHGRPIRVGPHAGGARASMRGGVSIGQLVVHNHREGDVREQIISEVEAAFEQLARDLDTQPMVGDHQSLL